MSFKLESERVRYEAYLLTTNKAGLSRYSQPLTMLVAFTTRRVEPGEQLFLYYGKSYREFRTYSAGNPSSVQCPNDVRRLFPSGVPWSCVVQIPRKLLDDEEDSGSDEEWKPGRRR